MSLKGKLLVLVGLNVLWSAVNFVVTIVNTAGFSPLAVGLVRWLAMALLIGGLVAIEPIRKRTATTFPSRADAGKAIIIGFCLGGPAHILYYLALTSKMPTVVGTILTSTSAFFCALFAVWLLKEHISTRRWSALGIGMIGAYLVTVGFALPALTGSSSAAATYLVGVIAESALVVLVAPIIRRSSPLGTLVYTVGGQAAFYVTMTLLNLPQLPLIMGSFSAPVLASFAYLVIGTGVVCFGVWYWLTKSLPVSLMTMSGLLQPPLSAILGYWLLQESLAPAAILGSVIIGGAVLLASLDPALFSGRGLHVAGAEQTN